MASAQDDAAFLDLLASRIAAAPDRARGLVGEAVKAAPHLATRIVQRAVREVPSRMTEILSAATASGAFDTRAMLSPSPAASCITGLGKASQREERETAARSDERDGVSPGDGIGIDSH